MYRKPHFIDLSYLSEATNRQYMLLFLVLLVTWFPATSFADEGSSLIQNISLQLIEPDAKGGFAYRLEYHVSASMESFWLFKTDFKSKILLTNEELLEHRVVSTLGNGVITENRYATAPGLRFMWQTTVFKKQYRLEFELLNAEECRHKFHYGTIQLSREGDYTKVTQIAYFDFKGAALWVKYPWYGGMKSTLTKVAKWEQQIARRDMQTYLVDNKNRERAVPVPPSKHTDKGRFEDLGGPTN